MAVTMTPGTVVKMADLIQPVPGCTVSRELMASKDGALILFALAEGTDISPETYSTTKLIWNLNGDVDVYSTHNDGVVLDTNEALWTVAKRPVGFRSKKGAVYLELAPGRTEPMMKNILPGEVFSLAELVPYQEGTIVNRDILHTPGMKFVVMAFDQGTALSEHAAPGNAILFDLEGEAAVTYEGVEHTLHPGQSILFAKNGKHAVKALTPFKMALLIALEQ